MIQYCNMKLYDSRYVVLCFVSRQEIVRHGGGGSNIINVDLNLSQYLFYNILLHDTVLYL